MESNVRCGDEVAETSCDIVCFADDTLLLVTARDVHYVCETASRQIRRLLRVIDELGLKIAEEKTEATLFTIRGLLGNPRIRVGRSEIEVKGRMKYLGIIIDSRLSFAQHFDYIETKAAGILRALGFLMPNLRGPSQARRMLHYNVVMSILTYGAPVWSREYAASTWKQRPVKRIQRAAASRVICAYRTVSLDAALLLAGVPRFSTLVNTRTKIYHRLEDLKKEDSLTAPAIRRVRNEELALMRDEWRAYLARPGLAGTRTLGAIRPHLDSWLDRRHGGLTYRITQILTGHGCFDTFLWRIGKSPSAACHHCPGLLDSAEHNSSSVKHGMWSVRVCVMLLDERFR